MRVQAGTAQGAQYTFGAISKRTVDGKSNAARLFQQADQFNIRFGGADAYAYLTETPDLSPKEQELGKRLKALMENLSKIKANGGIEHDWREHNVRKFELDGQLYGAKYTLSLLQIAPVDAWRPNQGPESGGELFGTVRDMDVEDGFFLQVSHGVMRLVDHRNGEQYDYKMPSGGDKLNHLRILAQLQALLEVR